MKFLAKKVVFLVLRGKNEISSLNSPWKNLYGYLWKKSAIGLPLEKILWTPMVAPLLKVSAPHDTEDGCKYKRSFCCDVNRFCKKTVVTQQLMNRKLNLPHTPRISFCVTSTTVFGEEEVGCINEKAIRYTVFRMGC